MENPTNEHDDSGLVQALLSGDQGAFDQLMRKHGPSVYRYAWAIADSRDQVDDLVQDTFLVLWRRRRRVTLVGDSLLPWLLATCRFTAFNSNRRRRRTSTVPLESVAHIVTHGSDPTVRDELRWVTDEIAQLSDRDQRLVDACIVQGRPYEDAALELGISAATARKRMQRVRERLQVAQIKEES